MARLEENTKKEFDPIKALKTLVFLVLGGALIWLVWYFLIRPLTDNRDGGIFQSGKQEDVDVDSSLRNKSDLSPSQAQAYADNLQEAIMDVGTDEGAVVKILAELNAADYEYVFEKFGKQNYDTLTGGSGIVSLMGENVNLTDILQYEFEKDENIYYNYLPEIFEGSTSFPAHPNKGFGYYQHLKAKEYLAQEYPSTFA